MSPRRLLEWVLLASGLAGVTAAAHADAIYKYIDEKGSVTYTSVRLKGGGKAEKLDAPEPPSAEDVAAARRQVEIDKQRIEKYEAERREQEAAEAAYLQQAQQFASQQALAAGEGEDAGYYPVWGVGPAFRPIRLRPKPIRPIKPISPHPHSRAGVPMSKAQDAPGRWR